MEKFKINKLIVEAISKIEEAAKITGKNQSLKIDLLVEKERLLDIKRSLNGYLVKEEGV